MTEHETRMTKHGKPGENLRNTCGTPPIDTWFYHWYNHWYDQEKTTCLSMILHDHNMEIDQSASVKGHVCFRLRNMSQFPGVMFNNDFNENMTS